jgi:hypothetical protein
MRRRFCAASLLLLLTALSACASGAFAEPEGLRVEAQQDVLLSEEPLQDVVLGHLTRGDEVSALCFVQRAQTQLGSFGSAIKVNTGDVTGYAAVTDFPHDPADRKQMFDLDAETLRDRLPGCAR